ncbi:hypothetical protein [Burkholderia sp. TSV86]|uniref:hypothetical protein n=1 Tax=Burkholderia sp. TSV86 TaxID=1385594 RepID=UPI0012E3BE20|nr:hypothetical protein [Burkholderia sp. TSV86]
MINIDRSQSLDESDPVISGIPTSAQERAAELIFQRYRLSDRKDEFVVALIVRLLLESNKNTKA